MKRTFSILFALALAVSFNLLIAIPMAAIPDLGLNHFLCYQAEGVPVEEFVHLEDQFNAVDAIVLDPRYLCNPVDKYSPSGDSLILNPNNYLTLYWLDYTSEPQSWTVEVENQFGTHQVVVANPVMLGVPTQLNYHTPPEALDHFLMYPVVEGPSLNVTVDLVDHEWGSYPGVAVIKPTFLANPVDKNHGGIVNNVTHLVFYEIDVRGYWIPPSGGEEPVVLPSETYETVYNQFLSYGGQTLRVLEPVALTYLGVPSLKVSLVPGPLTKSVTTATGTGTANFGSSHGVIEYITAVATPPNCPAALPHGMFSFNITGLTPDQNVTLTIMLPDPVPVGTKWWKYQAGSWYWLPIGSDDGDNIITVTLQDSGVGDGDTIPGQITDPGGPGYPVSVPIPVPVSNVYDLIISSTSGGNVTTPGEGLFPYSERRVVKLVASPDAGYKFVNWTGDVDTVEDVNNATTKITMNGDYSINATFATEEDPPYEYTLRISSNGGGSVTSPGEGTYAYEAGTTVNLVASPDFGYEFVSWTGDGITHPDFATTTVTMNGDHSIKAKFEFEQTTTDSTEESSGPLACFIATAAYRTPMAKEVQILREFRDEYLLTNPLGQAFVDFYYRISPPIAEFITEHPSLKPIVRAALVPAVVMSTVAVNTSPAENMAIVGLLVLVFVALAIWSARRPHRGPERT